MESQNDYSIFDLLDSVISNKLNEAKLVSLGTGDNTLLTKLKSLIIYVKFDLRVFAISHDAQVEKLWEYVRVDEDVFDFIMSVKAGIITRYSRIRWQGEINAVANAFMVDNYSEDMDEDTRDRLPSGEWLKDKLLSNDWLFLLYLISLMELPSGFLEKK